MRSAPHFKNIKRLFFLKAVVWLKLRNVNKLSDRAKVLLNHYKAITKRINVSIHSAKLLAEQKKVNSADIKKCYCFANDVLKQSHRTFSLKTPDGNIVYDPKIEAKLFNDCFLSSFVMDNHITPSSCHVFHHQPKTCHISSVLFPVSAVITQLNKLKNSRTITLDIFSSHTMKTLGLSIARPLATIFESFFCNGFIPPVCKMSFITPIHKSGSQSDPKKYRPIAITSLMCRMMERIIHNQLSFYLRFNNLLL